MRTERQELYGFRSTDGHEPAYAKEFVVWMRNAVVSADTERLLRTLELAPHARRPHPTTEHFLPLLVAAGASAGADGAVTVLDGGFAHGVLAMESYVFHPGIDATRPNAHKERLMSEPISIQSPATSAAQPILLFHGVGSTPESMVPLGRLLATEFPGSAVLSAPTPDRSDMGAGFHTVAASGALARMGANVTTDIIPALGHGIDQSAAGHLVDRLRAAADWRHKAQNTHSDNGLAATKT